MIYYCLSVPRMVCMKIEDMTHSTFLAHSFFLICMKGGRNLCAFVSSWSWLQTMRSRKFFSILLDSPIFFFLLVSELLCTRTPLPLGMYISAYWELTLTDPVPTLSDMSRTLPIYAQTGQEFKVWDLSSVACLWRKTGCFWAPHVGWVLCSYRLSKAPHSASLSPCMI